MHGSQQQQMMSAMSSPPAVNPQQLMNRLGQLGIPMGGPALGNLGQQMLAIQGGGGPMSGAGPMGDGGPGGNGVGGEGGPQGPSNQQRKHMDRQENAGGRWENFESKRARRY